MARHDTRPSFYAEVFKSFYPNVCTRGNFACCAYGVNCSDYGISTVCIQPSIYPFSTAFSGCGGRGLIEIAQTSFSPATSIRSSWDIQRYSLARFQVSCRAQSKGTVKSEICKADTDARTSSFTHPALHPPISNLFCLRLISLERKPELPSPQPHP